MTGAVELRDCSGAPEWVALLDADPRATPFHEWRLLQDLAGSAGWRDAGARD